MKILIAGSRSINEFDFSPLIPKDATLIISGGAKGIDTLAEKYADEHRISNLILLPQYNLHGKAAPLKRNEIMVDIADMVIVYGMVIFAAQNILCNMPQEKAKIFFSLPYPK